MGRPTQRFAIAWADMWIDDDFRDLSTEGRMLFTWAWMNPHAAICGLYRASFAQLCEAVGESVAAGDTWADVERVGGALAELDEKPMVLYDRPAEVLWVVNRCRYTLKESKGRARALDVMRREVEVCPPTMLLEPFIEKYGEALGIAMPPPRKPRPSRARARVRAAAQET